MDKQILQNETPERRLALLQDSADKVERFTYTRELSLDEIQDLQASLSDDLITISKADRALKGAKAEHQETVKPIKKVISKNLGLIQDQIEEVTEEVYLMKDLEEGKMGFYSKDGLLVFERKLRSEETQYSITEQLRKIN
jgi:hypothetical protein